LGFGAVVAGNVGGITMGILGDSLLRFKFKISLIIIYIISSVLMIWVTLSLPSPFVSGTLIPTNKWIAGSVVILSTLILGSSQPLFYELAAEITFPVNEGSSAGILTLIQNLSCLILLYVADFIPANWMNSIVAVTTILSAPAIFAITEKYKRSKLKVTQTSKP